MKKVLVFWLRILVIFYLCNQKIYSNGGPLDELIVKNLGQHIFINVETIQLLNENLYIRILGEFVTYKVNYEFINKGKAVSLNYGFPISFYDYTAGEKEINIKEIVRDFKITDSGKNISYNSSIESTNDEKGNDIRKIWYRAELTFKENEKRKIEIIYTVKSSNNDMFLSKSSFLPYFGGKRETNYSFTGAKYWGDGKANSIVIHIDSRPLIELEGKIISKMPEGYTENNGVFTKVYNNIAFDDIPDLLITYNNEKDAFSKYVKQIIIPKKAIKNIRASSTLKGIIYEVEKYNYAASNLIDDSSKTSWVEGEKGTGEGVVIEFEIDNDYKILAIGILNGYLKNEKTYKENGKVKLIKVEFNGKEVTDKRIYETKDRKYSEFNPKNVIPFVDWIVCVVGYSGIYSDVKPTKIKLIIKSAVPGSKYSDIAISELYLLKDSLL